MSAASIVQTLTDVAGELDLEYHTLDEPLPPEALTIILAAIRDCRAGLNVLYQRVEADLLLTAGEKRFVVPGLGEVEILHSTKRTQWDNDALTRQVVSLALDERTLNEETGEFEPAHEAVARVLSECARPSWRVLPLRKRGIQVDEFCKVDEGAFTVKLPPRSAS